MLSAFLPSCGFFGLNRHRWELKHQGMFLVSVSTRATEHQLSYRVVINSKFTLLLCLNVVQRFSVLNKNLLARRNYILRPWEHLIVYLSCSLAFVGFRYTETMINTCVCLVLFVSRQKDSAFLFNLIGELNVWVKREFWWTWNSFTAVFGCRCGCYPRTGTTVYDSLRTGSSCSEIF